MILVLVLLHVCNLLPVSPIHLGNRFTKSYDVPGTRNISNIDADRTAAGSEPNATDQVQVQVGPSEVPVIIKTLPVGAGDATIIVCPQIHHKWFSLIDMGSLHHNGVMTRQAYVSYIEEMLHNGYKLKHIFLTHPDKDHLNYGYEGDLVSLLPMIRDSDYYPKDITIHLSSLSNWDDPTGNSVFMRDFIRYLIQEENFFNWNFYDPENANANEFEICDGQDNLPEVKMRIIAANLNSPSPTIPNKKSMVMSLSIKEQKQDIGSKMLFLGDFEGKKQYTELLSNPKYSQYLPADVVMVPHHGSDTNGNGNQDFYNKVNAKHAIISSHIMSSYYHPRLTTLDSICDRYNNEELPYDTCEAWKYCIDGMAQAYEDLYPFGFNANNEDDISSIGSGLVHFYEDSLSLGCMTKIHQTTKIRTGDGFVQAYIVETKLYPNPNQAPVIVSQKWP